MRTAIQVGIVGALLAASIGMPWLIQQRFQTKLRVKYDAMQTQSNALALSIDENRRLSNLVARTSAAQPLTAEQLRELLRLRNELRQLREQATLAARLQEENRRLKAGLADETSIPEPLSPAEFQAALIAELTAAMNRILPALPAALRQHASSHSNNPPTDFRELEGYFPTVDGKKMAGLSSFRFVREAGPKPGDALILMASAGNRSGGGGETRLYGFSDGRVTEVASEDRRFDPWEQQHLTTFPADTGEKVYLESESTARDRGKLIELGSTIGISTEDASRFFDQVRQQQEILGPKLAALEKNLAGTPEEKQKQMQAAIEAELIKLASETLGDKGPALVQKLLQPATGRRP